MKSPFFSVVIPTCNRPALLKRAIDSVLLQTFTDFEVIICDDHSIDDTKSVVASFSDPRIKYMLNNRTKGACGARNTGVYASSGDWIAFLDDDDLWLPDKLQLQYNLICSSNHNIGLVSTDYLIIKQPPRKPVEVKNRLHGWVHKKVVYGGNLGSLSSMCIKKSILIDLNGFDDRFPSNQDWDLWIRISKVSTFAYIPKILVHMYQEKRNRIGRNYKGKLLGAMLLRDKYSGVVKKDLRLVHRYESHIFIFAFVEKKIKIILKCLPYVCLGIFIDCKVFLKDLRTALLLANRQRNE